jgi:hypothetical protein
MTQTIKIKRTTNLEAETPLEFGELALVNASPGVAEVYIGGSGGEIISVTGSSQIVAGAGLSKTGNTLFVADSQQTLSATGSITSWNSTVYVSNTSNITLPTPTSNAGKKVTIKKTDTGTTTTILPASGTIDGDANFEMPYQYDSITIESDGTNYFIVDSYSNTIDGGVF